jgi:short-subunit dehydrogenase
LYTKNISALYTLITGATEGIGKSLAIQFAAAGHHLALCARGSDQLILLKKHLEQRYNIKVFVRAADFSRKPEAILWAEQVKKEMGTPTVLIHNVGMFAQHPLFHQGEGDLEAMLRTNLLSAHAITTVFRQGMMQQGHGHIFNMVSSAAVRSRKDAPAYSISKAALLAWSDALFEEMRPHGVRVTAVLPGPVYTHAWKDVPLDPARFIHPDEVARMVYECFRTSGMAITSRLDLRSMDQQLDP